MFSPQAPRQLDQSVLRDAVLFAMRRFPATSKPSRKVLRLIYGRKFKHMGPAGASLKLLPTSHPQIWEIYWRGGKLGETVPYPPPLENPDLWLMATGPSINRLDLKKIKGQALFGVNGAIAVCSKHGILPTYYASSDHNFFNERMQLIKAAVSSGSHCFFSFNGISRICEQAPEILARGKISLFEVVNRYYGTAAAEPSDVIMAAQKDDDIVVDPANPAIGWSHDITKGVFAAKTIVYSACQISAYLKAKNVFILGMDLGHVGPYPERAYESGSKACSSSLDKDYSSRIYPSFKLLSELNLSSEFWNLSAQSRLPMSVIPHISFEQALSRIFPH
ncbi:MAG: hypothetical protein P8R37_01775 [Opitutae bacterium]|nr:hypothetical protein [Opitutae bacterium]